MPRLWRRSRRGDAAPAAAAALPVGPARYDADPSENGYDDTDQTLDTHTHTLDTQTIDTQTIDGLLDDVRGLRLMLATDLTAAAGAAEAGALEVARDIVNGDRRDLARFAFLADRRLRSMHGLAAAAARQEERPEPRSEQRPRWRRRLVATMPAIPLAGALAAAAAAATGVLPAPSHSGHPAAHPTTGVTVTTTASAPVTTTLKQFETVLNSDPSESQVIAAATALHNQLAALIETAPVDPARTREIAQVLQLEQVLLLDRQPPGGSIVLAASRQLAAQLATIVTITASATSPPAVSTSPVQVTTPPLPKKSAGKSTPTASAKPSPSPSPTKTKTSSTPTPAPTPAPSQSSAPGSNLPQIP